MPIVVHRSGESISLSVQDGVQFRPLLHVLFTDDAAVIDSAQLSSFQAEHRKAASTTIQIGLIVFDKQPEKSFNSMWKSIAEQLQCSQLMLTQCLSRDDFQAIVPKAVELLIAKYKLLKLEATKLTTGLEQKELLWAQMNASKKVTKAKELVNAHMQNPSVGSLFYVAGDMWQSNDSIVLHVGVSVRSVKHEIAQHLPQDNALADVVAANGLVLDAAQGQRPS